MRSSVMVLTLLVVPACSSSGSFHEEFVQACTDSGNLEQPVCDCMADKAESDLSEDERQFVLAALQEDEDKTTELRDKLGMQGAMRAGLFMTNVASCAMDQMEP